MRKEILIVFLFLSCGFAEEYAHMKVPDVSDYSHDEGCIQITFSSEMERGITEHAFSCLCNGEEVSGIFVWDEKKMNFYPETGIKKKCIYEVQVGTRAEDKYGNSFKEVFFYTFSTKDKEETFNVQKMNILDGSLITDLFHPIDITFSSPVDKGSFYCGFEISPQVKGSISVKEKGHTIVFTPLEKYNWNSTYVLTLRKNVSDQHGNTLQSDYSISFNTIKEPKSTLDRVQIKDGAEILPGDVVNRDIEKDAVLILTYSGPQDYKTVRNPIVISPAQDYIAMWNKEHTQCNITFKKHLPYKTLLELSAEEKRYLLYVDGNSSQPLAVQTVKFYQDYTSGISEILKHGSGIIFETGEDACFEVVLSLGKSAEIFNADAYGTIDIAVARGNLTIGLKHLETEQIEPGVVCIRVFCSITAGTVQTPVIISVNGKLKDSFGNVLENDYVLRINGL